MADVDLTPTAEMARNAARGLELRREHGRGGTEVGVARARDISNGKTLSPETVRRMHAFFSRHAKNKAGGEDDAGYIAWMLWGGDEGRDWASRKVDALDRKERNAMSETRKAIMERLGMAAGGEKAKFAENFTSRLKSLITRFGFKPDEVNVSDRFGVGTISFFNQKGKATELVSRLRGAMKQMGVPESAITAREVQYPADEDGPAEHVGIVTVDFNKMPNARPGAKVRAALADACWEGYEAVGTKPRDGKTVPNCVPKATAAKPAETPAMRELGRKMQELTQKADRLLRQSLSASVTSEQSQQMQDEVERISEQLDAMGEDLARQRKAAGFEKPSDLEREDVKAGLKLMSASDPAVSDKIRTLIKEGKPQEQAVAIALDMKRRGEL